MTKHILLMVAAVGLLSGCVLYDEDYRDGRHSYSDRDRYGDRSHYRDRDRDGVPNSQDRRPDNPYRY